jgi:hypothetical protein
VVPLKSGVALQPSDIAQARLDAGVRARAARDSFHQVIVFRRKGDAESADAALSEAKDRTFELWAYTSLRSQAFRSLLGTLDAAIRHSTVADFGDGQLDCLMNAYAELPKNHLAQADVSARIRDFAAAGVDLTGPLRERIDESIRITIERVK